MKTELIIPNLDNDGSDNAALIERNISAMCAAFGGATVYQANGYWINESGTLFRDPVSVIVSAATEKDGALSVLREAAREILNATDQEAVFIAVGDQAEIIE
ncbi:DUF3574 domain-containing protein [Pacificoceanicola onchidii]|uniref:DUF3574 domain-containing protein n=1 Tax=Pacificoceanicola onchidii TaxID=2562685 RepID=UPI0010A5DA30|nr:DUF3574 domain-containing protein [Pacificoceanicola onchidii]